MRLMPRVFILLMITVIFVGYQNFSTVNSEEWDSTNTLKIIQEMNQFEKNDRPAPNAFATPQGGSDLKSVSNNWMQRQGSIFLNGYDKKLESAVNDKLNSWVQMLSDDTDKEPPKIGEKSTTGSASAGSTQAGSVAKRKQSLRFTRVNSLDYRFGDAGNFNVTADPGNTSLNYSQSFFLNTKLGFEHKTADNKTQMILRYEW